ncbi:hypothetical protein Dsin_012439 [Dipteronia sinensis]|uniref:DUF4283 domain-containing protein n=1 Tax=Dipteronia sinensis TaxID=43782 RepID=A0AAE0E862_9ROSI|nr:hypothetical protein Dsin_012439 [Dipteronia sinensis]
MLNVNMSNLVVLPHSGILRNSKLHHEEGISITPTLVNNSETVHSSYSNVLKGTDFGPNMHIPAIRPMNLKFYQLSYCGNRKCVSLPLEIAENGSKAWKNCLVGYFIEKKPLFSLVNNIAMRLWGNRGLQEVLANDQGFFFFKFLDDEACSNVLESVISAVNSEIEPSLCHTNLTIKIQFNVLSKETCMEPPPPGSLKVDEVISTSHAENEPSLRPTNLSIHDQCHDLSKETVVDTSNKFAALVEDGDYRNDQCNELCDDADQCNDKFAALV